MGNFETLKEYKEYFQDFNVKNVLRKVDLLTRKKFETRKK